jgi:menaquinone-9 beta-reductase
VTSGKEFDAVIVGGGPAGASLAIRLATAGLKIAIVDKASFPRDKLCGEFISSECVDHFEELGVRSEMENAGARAIERTVFYSASGKTLEFPSTWFSPGRPALGLSRAQMDAVLISGASRSGAAVFEKTRISRLVRDGDRAIGLIGRSENGTETAISGRLIVDATGRAIALSRLAAVGAQPQLKATQVAFKAHVTGAHVPATDCEIYAYRGGYGGCVSVEGHRQNICFIVEAADARRLQSDPVTVLHEVVFKNKRAREALSGIRPLSPWLAVPIARYGRASLTPAKGLISVGDAASFIDPFTGSGMLIALESAKVAATVITEWFENGAVDFSAVQTAYHNGYGAAFGRRLRAVSFIRLASRVPMASEAVIGLLSKNDRAARFVAAATRFNGAHRAG